MVVGFFGFGFVFSAMEVPAGGSFCFMFFFSLSAVEVPSEFIAV